MPNPGYDEPYYRTFLLRVWQERSASAAGSAVWRFSLEDIRTRQRRGFGDLEALVAFLWAQTEGERHD